MFLAWWVNAKVIHALFRTNVDSLWKILMQLCDAETKSDAKSDQIMVKLLKRVKGNSL